LLAVSMPSIKPAARTLADWRGKRMPACHWSATGRTAAPIFRSGAKLS
jgi:hypothetical protein